MKLQVVLASAAAVALVAGAAQAAPQKTGTYAEPSQPIAYSKLNTYLKSSSHSRKTKDWAIGAQAASAASAPNAAANASATAPANGMTQPSTGTAPANDMTQPSTATAPADQGAAAPAPSTSAPNPPATAPTTGAAPDTSMKPPATSAPK
jgi:hypothetical protein